MIRGLGLAIVLLCAWPLIARASSPELEEARRLVEVELRYREAIELLDHLAARRLVDLDRIEVNRLLAIAHVARGDMTRAEAAFRVVIDLDPSFELGSDVSPKIHSVLERVKLERARAPRLFDLTATPVAGGVAFDVRVHDPERRVVSVELYARTATGAFDRWIMQRSNTGRRARTEILLPPRGRGDASALVRLEYYLSALDAAQTVVARLGDARRLSTVILGASLDSTNPSAPAPPDDPEVAPRPRWFQSWLFWTTVAAGVLAAGAATAVWVTRAGVARDKLEPIDLD